MESPWIPKGYESWYPGKRWNRFMQLINKLNRMLGMGDKVDAATLDTWYRDWREWPENKDKSVNDFKVYVLQAGIGRDRGNQQLISTDQQMWDDWMNQKTVGSDIENAMGRKQ